MYWAVSSIPASFLNWKGENHASNIRPQRNIFRIPDYSGTNCMGNFLSGDLARLIRSRGLCAADHLTSYQTVQSFLVFGEAHHAV